MSRRGKTFCQFIVPFFDVRQEKEDEEQTIEALKADVEFKGGKMLILICAIFIASLGLNMNSTAVVIGAMLISPLMGPILGIGLGLGITDFNLIGKSFKYLGMAVVISVITSTIYFLISPISIAQSEILARTQPTAYDVLIALFGGFAGIIAGTSKSNKGQVIPGVAIATALMPPLCSAGYGLATWQLSYFFGAFYLFIINTVFIGLSTFIIVRILQYRKVAYVNKKRGKRLNNLVIGIVVCTIIPSIILAYQFVQETYQSNQREAFVKKELVFDNAFVISYDHQKTDTVTLFNVSVIGGEIPNEEIERLQALLPSYGLNKYRLIIKQGNDNSVEEIRHAILEDVQSAAEKRYAQYLQHRTDSLDIALKNKQAFFASAEAVTVEIRQLFNEIEAAQFGQLFSFIPDSALKDSISKKISFKIDTIPYIKLLTNKKMNKERETLIRNWLSMRFDNPQIEIKDNRIH